MTARTDSGRDLFYADDAERPADVCGVFGKSYDGERTANASAARRILEAADVTSPTISRAPVPAGFDPRLVADAANSVRAAAAIVLRRTPNLKLKDRQLLETMLTWRAGLTAWQLGWLTDLYEAAQRKATARLDDGSTG